MTDKEQIAYLEKALKKAWTHHDQYVDDMLSDQRYVEERTAQMLTSSNTLRISLPKGE